jgi:hypothetical protein
MSWFNPLSAAMVAAMVFAAVSYCEPNIDSQESRPMTYIDPLVVSTLETAGEASVPVLIVCEEQCQSVISALQRAGITVTNVESAEVGSIGASITSAQLDTVQSIAGISAVELDQEVETLESN